MWGADRFWDYADGYVKYASTFSKRNYFLPFPLLRMNGTVSWPKEDGRQNEVMIAALIGHNTHKYYALAATVLTNATINPWRSKIPHNVTYNKTDGIFRVRNVFVPLDDFLSETGRRQGEVVELRVDSADQVSRLGQYPLTSEVTFYDDAVFVHEVPKEHKLPRGGRTET